LLKKNKKHDKVLFYLLDAFGLSGLTFGTIQNFRAPA
jgi:hypothetical protein